MKWTHVAKTGALVAACALLQACGSREEAAFRSFAADYSCPRERVSVVPITGVTPVELWRRANPEPAPPAGLGNDPGRVAVWHRTREEENEGVLRGLKQYALFHASGCGNEVDYACYCPPQTQRSSSGRGAAQDHCGCMEPAAPIAPNER